MSIVRSSLVVLAMALTAAFSVPAALAQDAVLFPTAADTQYEPPNLNEPPTDVTWFGDAVAITDSVAYVGMPGYKAAPPSNVIGRVAIYKPNSTHTTWQRTGTIDVASTGDVDFGLGLAAQSTATTNYVAVVSGRKIRIFAKTGSAPWQKMSDYALTPIPSVYTQYFGGSLVWDGDTLAFTSYQVDQGGTLSSSVVLLRVTPTYQLQYVQTLLAPSGYSSMWGSGLSIDGDQMAIGAPSDSWDANGEVELFTRGSNGLWHSSSILPAPNIDADGFGWGVSLRGDHMVVGAPKEDPDTSSSFFRSGAAYAYVRQNGQWMLTQRLRPDLDAPQLVGSFYDFGDCVAANSQFAAIKGIADWQHGNGNEAGHLGLYQWQGGQLVLRKWQAPLSGYYVARPPDISTHYVIMGAPDILSPNLAESVDIDELHSYASVAGPPPVAH
jgi:hypothetical protein